MSLMQHSKARKIYIFSPLPPTRSGVSDYTVEQVSYLNEAWNAVVVIADDAPKPTCRSVKWIRKGEWKTQSSGEPILYHIGNNPYHEYAYNEALQTPGHMILHDFSLHHLLVELTLGRGDMEAYRREMELNYGGWGHKYATERIQNHRHSELMQFMLPLNARLLQNAKSIFVHSKDSMIRAIEKAPTVPIKYLPFPCEPEHEQKTANRSSANPQGVNIVSLGFVTPTKQISLVLDALSSIKSAMPRFCFHLVGEAADRGKLEREIQHKGLEGVVKLWGFVPLTTLKQLAANADIVINLRYPSAGETSAALFRAMASAKVNIVFDYGSFSELPNEVVVKLPLSTSTSIPLEEQLLRLGHDGALRQKIGRAALAHTRMFHDPAHTAKIITKQILDVECKPL